jgi:hypothetical protein
MLNSGKQKQVRLFRAIPVHSALIPAARNRKSSWTCLPCMVEFLKLGGNADGTIDASNSRVQRGETFPPYGDGSALREN